MYYCEARVEIQKKCGNCTAFMYSLESFFDGLSDQDINEDFTLCDELKKLSMIL